MAGFQGVTADLALTTLGRGGSDTSAVALAVALNAAFCEINTDVSGVYTSDPNIVPVARANINISNMVLQVRHTVVTDEMERESGGLAVRSNV